MANPLTVTTWSFEYESQEQVKLTVSCVGSESVQTFRIGSALAARIQSLVAMAQESAAAGINKDVHDLPLLFVKAVARE